MDLFSATDQRERIARLESSLRIANGVVESLAMELAEVEERVLQARIETSSYRECLMAALSIYQEEDEARRAMRERIRHLETVIETLREERGMTDDDTRYGA